MSERPELGEQQYWKKKKQEQWLRSDTYIKIRRLLAFLHNFRTFDISMDELSPAGAHLVYSVLQIRHITHKISLDSIELSRESLLQLEKLILYQSPALEKVRLTFEHQHRFKARHNLSRLCKILAQKPALRSLTLENWSCPSSLYIEGAALGDILRLTPISCLCVTRIDIAGYEGLTHGLTLNPTLRTLRLQSGAEFKQEEVQGVYAALGKNPRQLRRVELRNKRQIMQVAWHELAEILQVSHKIRELKIFPDSVKAQGAMAEVTQCLSANNSVRHITFSCLQRSSLHDSVQLLESLEQHQLLETLDLSYNRIDSGIVVDALCRILESCPRLHTLLFSHVLKTRDESRASCAPLLRKLGENTAARLVDLSSNFFTPEEQRALVGCVTDRGRDGPQLAELSLAYCGLSDSTLADLFGALRENKTVRSIDLRGQHKDPFRSLFSRTGPAIAQCLEQNQVLRAVDVSGNEFIDDEGMRLILIALAKNTGLLHAGIRFCTPADSHVGEELGKLLGSVVAQNRVLESLTLEQGRAERLNLAEFFIGLENNARLISLDLSSVAFSAGSVEVLGKMLEKNRVLRTLKVSGELEREALSTLSEGLARNTGMKAVSFKGSKIRRKDAVRFVKFIEENRTLERFQLYPQAVELEDADVEEVFETMMKNNTLKVMRLDQGLLSELGVGELRKISRKHFWLRVEIL